MTTNPKWQYTELVGATLDMVAGKGQYFIFGGMRCMIAQDRLDVRDGKLYAELWVARQSVGKWLGEFIPGSHFKRMRPIDRSVITTMSTVMELIKQGNELVKQGNDIIKQAIAMARDIPDTELDEQTAKIVQLIRRPDANKDLT